MDGSVGDPFALWGLGTGLDNWFCGTFAKTLTNVAELGMKPEKTRANLRDLVLMIARI